MTTHNTCGECINFDADHKQCRKNPPQPMLVPTRPSPLSPEAGMTVVAVWPPAEANGWCGEFEWPS